VRLCIEPQMNYCSNYIYKAQFVNQDIFYDVDSRDKIRNGDIVNVIGIGKRKALIDSEYINVIR